MNNENYSRREFYIVHVYIQVKKTQKATIDSNIEFVFNLRITYNYN